MECPRRSWAVLQGSSGSCGAAENGLCVPMGAELQVTLFGRKEQVQSRLRGVVRFVQKKREGE